MQYEVRVAGAGLAVALLTAGCADTTGSFGAPVAEAAAPAAAPATSRQPAVTAQEAQTTALDTVGGGWILETKIEEGDDADWGEDRDEDWDGDDDFEADVDVWEVTVVSSDGLRRTVSVDLTNGSVLDSRADD